jgi:hypothetical protein
MTVKENILGHAKLTISRLNSFVRMNVLDLY